MNSQDQAKIEVCPVCNNNAVDDSVNLGHWQRIHCDFCGNFLLLSHVTMALNHGSLSFSNVQRAALSCYIRRNHETAKDGYVLVNFDLVKKIGTEARYNPMNYIPDLIRHIGDYVSANGRPIPQMEGVDVQRTICAPSVDIVRQIVPELLDQGLVSYVDVSSQESPGYRNVSLTFSGWERYTAEQRGQVHGNFGFIAMKFFNDPNADSFGLPAFVDKIVKPAAKTATGYELHDIRHFQQSGVIDNYLRATIKDAAFVICDLTHDNHGAYWEAGYADALDKPVIYICEKSKFNKEQSHFDTNHCTTIFWKKDSDNNDFQQQLIATLRRSLDLFD